MGHKLILAAAIAVLSLFTATQLFSDENAIKERKGIMKSTNKASRALKGAVKDGNFTTVEENANKIAKNMDTFVTLFPKGSTAKNSRAKADIWKNFDDFKSKASKLQSTARQLANAAGSKNLTQVQEEYKALGNACRNCHRAYRGKRKRRK
ncbi:MAG: cytochrome c [Deltaproteobacteria bacterium]|nr:cytochrome c [Deltaproteobacteria bacterium]